MSTETDCRNFYRGEQCALGADHGGHEHIAASGVCWPAHIPWNPIDGYMPKTFEAKNLETGQSATL